MSEIEISRELLERLGQKLSETTNDIRRRAIQQVLNKANEIYNSQHKMGAIKKLNAKLTGKDTISSQNSNYEDNKKYQSYESRIAMQNGVNRAIFKIFENYFNTLSQDEEMQLEHGIKFLGFMSPFNYVDNISVLDTYQKTVVLLDMDGLLVSFIFDYYKSSGTVYYDIYIYTKQETSIRAEYMYETLFANAVKTSDLKGSYFTMPRESFHWNIERLEPRSFDDIYLPEKIMEDLSLYVKIFENDAKALRYLFVGNPGTGKTESCLVLTNELQKMGVTVIKTTICELLKEKMQLAEILKPSIVILDDIDLSLGSRNAGGFSKNLQVFLDVLDGTEKLSKQVGIIATTNSAHLLDLAAQRPGRFDKVVLFDSITKSNIKNIIIKSLKYNFGIGKENPIYAAFTALPVINKYYDSMVTGAYIYNSVNMILLRVNTLKLHDTFTNTWLIDEIERDITMSDKIRKYKTIEDKLQRERGKSLGFAKGSTCEGEELEIEDVDEPCMTKQCNESRQLEESTSNSDKSV